MSAAQAQSDPPADAPSLNLEEVVVTATPTGGSRMRQSLSVSTISVEQVLRGQATSSAEALRAIPGVRSESSGGEGNANLTVRGVPISAGGARYVQLQEDGLPILQFGDIAFGTPDSFLRIDGMLDRIEAVRGGSASTLATNSPGGVINFISRTGREAGGGISLSRGLGFDQTRYDFDYGSPVGDRLSFALGGFYRSGEGVRPAGVPGEDGGQIRGNVTYKLDNGHVRLNFKQLQDSTPTHLPVPVQTIDGRINTLPGIDPRRASFYSPYWGRDEVLDRNNQRLSTDVNAGLSVTSRSIGFETMLDLGGGWTLDQRFRRSSNTGRFTGIFPADNGTDGNFTVATGPGAGLPWAGRAFTATVFNTSIDDLGLTANDIKLSKAFQVAGGTLTPTFGLFTSIQNVALTWNFNQYLMQASGDKPALLATANTAVPGLLAAGTDVWGGCCNRTIDAKYRTNSPYAALGYEFGRLNLDGSVRFDSQTGTGTFNQAVNQTYSAANTRYIDYKTDHTSYSFGANYRLTDDLAVFGRVSDGVAFNADRIMFQSYQLNGSTPIPINQVKQFEGGVKWRGGPFSTFVTVFQAKTTESNYEATTRLTTQREYEARGVEIEAAYRNGGLRIAGGATLTHAEITQAEDASLVGKTPRRQASFVYQLMPTYTVGPVTAGAALIGTNRSWGDDGNTLVLPAFQVLNAFVNWNLAASTTLSVGVNNLLDRIGYTEVEGSGHAARSINGRSVRATLRYVF
jgi:outer membrane receptor protein involved in Fe transport